MAEITRRSALTGAASAATALGPLSTLLAETPAHAQQIPATVPLKQFLARADSFTPLTRAQRELIIDQALVLLEGMYAHLPLKRAMYGLDPVRRLKLLRERLPQRDRQFHSEMAEIFDSLNDLHTRYGRPSPYAIAHAWLPFKVEVCFEAGVQKYIVSAVAQGFSDANFKAGVEVKYWSGIPIERAVQLSAALCPGGNPDARRALAVARLTYRKLELVEAPDEEWVIVRYLAADGQERDIKLDWQVTDEALASGNTEAAQIQEFRKFLFAPYNYENDSLRPPERFTTPDGEFGYIRVFSFLTASADQFVTTLKSHIASLQGTRGLIIDVRDNPGGSTGACERSIQMIAAGPIEPEHFYFVNTDLTLRLCKLGNVVSSLGVNGLKDWIPSIERSRQTGAIYSASFPYTNPLACRDIGRVYSGPVVVVTSARTYSAAEIFAAGFQDHKGKILGVDDTTGGGGANQRTHTALHTLFKNAQAPALPEVPPFKDLPNDGELYLAFRRCQRVGANAGLDIEDFGVSSDARYKMTRNDLLNSNADLKKAAAAILAQM
jgi:hypothetical protein